MPRNQLTTEHRRKAAAHTNKIGADRKAKRQARVKVMVDKGIPKKEIARLEKVRPETISRDCKALKKECATN